MWTHTSKNTEREREIERERETEIVPVLSHIAWPRVQQ
jgi:hypothetical protein